MAGTYTQIYIHAVFVVKGRENLIHKSWKHELNRYISGILTAKQQKSIIVNGGGDHIHCFFGLKPTIALSDLMREIKNNSSKFINDKGFVKGKFQWQEGYGAFSYSNSQIKVIYDYILNQEEHHNKKSFREEYIELLQSFKVDYKIEYLFDWIE